MSEMPSPEQALADVKDILREWLDGYCQPPNMLFNDQYVYRFLGENRRSGDLIFDVRSANYTALTMGQVTVTVVVHTAEPRPS